MNTKDNWLTTATIHDEPRRSLWSVVFPDGVVPIKSIFTLKLSVPEHHHDVDCYMLDLDALGEEQLDRAVAVINLRFGIPMDEIRRELHQGVPILAEGVTVATSDRKMWFAMMDDDIDPSVLDELLEEDD